MTRSFSASTRGMRRDRVGRHLRGDADDGFGPHQSSLSFDGPPGVRGPRGEFGPPGFGPGPHPDRTPTGIGEADPLFGGNVTHLTENPGADLMTDPIFDDVLWDDPFAVVDSAAPSP